MVFGWWAVWVVALLCGSLCQPLESRPTRPKSFSSPDDLRTYLDQLGNYYAVASRPRFGKRSPLSPRSASYPGEVYYRLPMPDLNDFYDLYQMQDD